MHYVYVLKSLRNGKRYVGVTNNVLRRLAGHQRGVSTFTSQNRPWVLMWKEALPSKQDAVKREKYLKSGQGRKFLDTILSSSEIV